MVEYKHLSYDQDVVLSVLGRTAVNFVGRRGLLKHENFALVDGEIREITDYTERAFPRQPDAIPSPITNDAVVDALQAAFWPIEHHSLTAWGEHIPFMFSAFTLLKPRRFVELGVHNGASFFAACQAVQRQQLACECIAIDGWIGDVHAGEHDSSIFGEFCRDIASYRDFAGYLRMNFEEALSKFADGSIDLLHIDGLHTADAVRRDFDQWIGKMSDQGVILFHDTNEFKADFGVWRFWRKIREQYPHIEFDHGHGLGVLVVGKKSALQEKAKETELALLSPIANELVQVIFGNVGRLNWAASAPVVHNPPPPAPTFDPAGLHSRIADLEYQLQKYNKSIYGRARRALRRIRTRIKGRTSSH